MKQVGELSRSPESLRKKFWLESLKLPLEWKDFSEEEKQTPGSLLKNSSFDAVLLDTEFSDALYPLAQKKPTAVIESGMADCLFKEQGTMWLRCLIRETVKQLILQKAPALDTHSTCYLTGSSPVTRMCAVVAIQMGFRQLVTVAHDSHEAQVCVENLQKLFFDLEFRILRPTELTLQPNNGSLLINTMTAEEGGVIFEDLTYLNFLHEDSLVVDLPITQGKNELLEEARHVGLLQASGLEIWGTRDWFFLKTLLKDEFQISLSEYLKSWESHAHSQI